MTINVEKNVGFIEINKEQYNSIKKFKKSNNFFLITDYKKNFRISKDSFSRNYGLNILKVDKLFKLNTSNGNTKFLNKILNKIIDIQNEDTIDTTIVFN